MNRRSVLGLLGGLPVIGPGLAAKLTHEAGAGLLTGIQTQGLSFGSAMPPSQGVSPGARLALQLPWFKDELTSILAENNRHIGALDPDLAVLRSLSLAAKICYQRQRNIQRSLDQYGREEPWQRMNNLVMKAQRLLGL